MNPLIPLWECLLPAVSVEVQNNLLVQGQVSRSEFIEFYLISVVRSAAFCIGEHTFGFVNIIPKRVFAVHLIGGAVVYRERLGAGMEMVLPHFFINVTEVVIRIAVFKVGQVEESQGPDAVS